MAYCSAEQMLRERLEEIDLEGLVSKELAKNKVFSLYEHSDDILIHFQHGERGESQLNVGFPFPLSSSSYTHGLNNLKINFFIRGEVVRRIQREMLKDWSSDYQEVDRNFPRLFREVVGKNDRIIYADPYGFIGDSFIGLHFLDSFSSTLGIDNAVVFSNQHEHISGKVRSRDYIPQNLCREVKDGDLIIAPDLIDTHWNKTLETIRLLKGRKTKMVIPGRGLLLDFNSDDVRVYHANTEDTLLRNKNIEDYMNDCLDVFGVQGCATQEEQKYFGSSRFFFNPFAAKEARYISPELIFAVYKALKRDDEKTEFYLVSDYHNNPTHVQWLNRFLKLMRTDGSVRRVSINYYSHLDELADHMKEKECGAVLTADTSIAHLTNAFGYPCVTLHNPFWWDANSLQSLSASSPAGFCRYFKNQIPVINGTHTHEGIKRTAELLAQTMLFAQMEDKDKRRFFDVNSKWVNAIYTPEKLTAGVIDRDNNNYLLESAKKVSLQYKMRRTR